MTWKTPRDRLIVALDLPTVEAAEAMTRRLGDAVSFYKIGYQLAFTGGIDLARRLISGGAQVFLDLKLHDIGATVERGVASISGIGATFLTVHGYPQTMRAAVAGRAASRLKLLAVTVMTSYDDGDLREAGYAEGVAATVARRAGQAMEIGVDGLIVSPEELPSLAPAYGSKLALVTPGVRPAGAALGDQKRVATPGAAIAGGAAHVVVGRPVTSAADPRAAAEAIVAEIAAAGS